MSRLVPRCVAALGLLVGLVVACGPAKATPQAAATETGVGDVTVMTFNMCGEHCNTDSTTDDIADLMSKINAVQPNAVLLQEACQQQATALMTESTQEGNWSLAGFQRISEPQGCTGGDGFGDVVLVHGTFIAVGGKDLKYPHGHGAHRQVRQVTCGKTLDAFPRTVEVCTVHAGLDFEIGKRHQAKQIKQAYNFARRQDPTDPLIFGGDFNVVPSANALDVVYAKGGGGARGAMEEVDACPGKHGRKHHKKTCNRKTHDPTRDVKHRTKNDYIFLSHKSFKSETADIVKSKYSDHDILVGHAFLCASGTC